MNKFKVGDRVSGIYGKIKGYKGVVVEVDTGIKCDRILCRFKNFEGHKGNGHTKTGKATIRQITGICIHIRLN